MPALKTQDKTPPGIVAIQMALQEKIGDLAKACPKSFSPDRMIQVVGILAYKTPKLQECDKGSLILSVVQAASLGLDLNPALPEGYLIPRWNDKAKCMECTFMPGYQGLAKLARNAGNLRYLQAKVVHKADKFRTWNDPEPRLEHEEFRDGDPGPLTWVYAVAKLQTGETLYECMSLRQIEDIRQRSDSYRKYPDTCTWATDFEEMAKKTVIKRLCKSLPRSTELARAIEIDNAEYEPRAAIENDSGHGRGQYASPEQTESYLERMLAYIDKRNQQWLDRWQEEDGSFPHGIKRDLVNKYQADNHLIKWARETGRLEVDEKASSQGIQSRQLGRYTAIIYHRSQEDRAAIARELARYIDEQESRAIEALKRSNPELFPHEKSEDEILDEIAASQGKGDAWEPEQP